VATPPTQLAPRQVTPASGKAQATRLEPSQAPPQAEPSEAHCGRPLTGAPTTGEQVPVSTPRLHASHWPVQPVSQQTPSTQWPFAHWFEPEQVAPSARSAVQTPAEHQKPLVQSASRVQPLAQAVGPHRFGAQGWVCGAGQRPDPSQLAPRVATPPVQLASRHETSDCG
jgi:hypothetical protein